MFSEDTVKAGDGTGITALAELDPEDDEAGMRVSAAHIADQPKLLRGMLIGMRMGASGAIPKGVPGAVIASFPTVDILSVGLIFDSSFGNAKTLSIFD